MIKLILEMLQLDEHYGQSETIEIAKGKYQLHNNFNKGFKQIKRELKCLKQKQ